MEHTIENIKKVALIFFLVTGALHLGSSMFIANNVYAPTASVINKIMDIPLVLTGLIYGFSALRLSFADPNKSYKKLDIFLITTIIVILVALIAINIAIPNL